MPSPPVAACPRRRIPDNSLGLLLDRCTRLKRLLVFGLNQITTRSLYGHSNAAVAVEGLHTSIHKRQPAGARKGAAGAPARAGADADEGGDGAHDEDACSE